MKTFKTFIVITITAAEKKHNSFVHALQLTHWGRDKMANIFQTIFFKHIFLNEAVNALRILQRWSFGPAIIERWLVLTISDRTENVMITEVQNRFEKDNFWFKKTLFCCDFVFSISQLKPVASPRRKRLASPNRHKFN